VEEQTAPLETPLEGGGIGEIAVHDLDGATGEEPPRIAGPRQDAHTMTRGDQTTHDGPADEAGPSGHNRHVPHTRLIAGHVSAGRL
jgi:hypothetical protein